VPKYDSAQDQIHTPGEWFITAADERVDQWAMTLTELGREYGVLRKYEELI
jgi:hypothetical protein